MLLVHRGSVSGTIPLFVISIGGGLSECPDIHRFLPCWLAGQSSLMGCCVSLTCMGVSASVSSDGHQIGRMMVRWRCAYNTWEGDRTPRKTWGRGAGQVVDEPGDSCGGILPVESSLTLTGLDEAGGREGNALLSLSMLSVLLLPKVGFYPQCELCVFFHAF